MELLFISSAIFLALFMILATYDGAYLHIWKFELFNQEDSVFEHKIHTIRAILFPLIVVLLFIRMDYFSFLFGIFFVLVDLVVLGIDAYYEKDSRKFMGGLPKWEYIVHLFSNTFHFAAIALAIATRLSIKDSTLIYAQVSTNTFGQRIFDFVAINAIPGAIVLAILHVLLVTDFGRHLWNRTRIKITCC